MIDFYSRDFRNIYLKDMWNCAGGPPGMKSVVSRSLHVCGRYGPSGLLIGSGYMVFAGGPRSLILPASAETKPRPSSRRFRSETGTRGRWTDAPPALFPLLIGRLRVLVLQAVISLHREEKFFRGFLTSF